MFIYEELVIYHFYRCCY